MQNKFKHYTKVQTELITLIAPYTEHWAVWTKTKNCFLSEQEVKLTELLLKHGNLNTAAKILKITYRKVSLAYTRIKDKLLSYKKEYLYWLNPPKTITKKQSAKYSAQAQFLDASFRSRYYPAKLGKLLANYGHNMFELLKNCRAADLDKTKLFGKKRMEELRLLLAEHDCEMFLEA